MTNLGKYLIALALVLGAIGTLLGLGASHLFGTANPAQVNGNPVWDAGGVTIGQQGTFIGSTYTGGLKFGTCNAATTGLPAVATTTITMTCSAPGVYTSDNQGNVDVSLASNPTAYGAFIPLAPSVTTSASAGVNGTITFQLLNDTGTATSSFPLATTSVEWIIVR
jgi:hypothetical protein